MNFEEWAISELMEGNNDPLAFRKDVHGRYMDGPMQLAYRGWKGATQAEREACAKVCDEIANATEPDDFALDAVNEAAAAIRMRSNKEVSEGENGK
jgi:hypothetical protein